MKRSLSQTRRQFLAAATAATTFALPAIAQDIPINTAEFPSKIVEGARNRIGVTTVYDPAYVSLIYPMGDVKNDRGVCTDVLIRAFRHAGVDLQKHVHEDMRANFSDYPRIWGLTRPDRNIDHRRVPNLETFFKRKGASLPVGATPDKLEAGDIVTWRLTGSGLPHCGIVATGKASKATVHNIGSGTKEEDVLTDWPITHVFRTSEEMFA